MDALSAGSRVGRAEPAAGLSYRADIDGLRAVAVLPVVLFHAGIPGLGGGFVGVDVFFVISGYLITSIIRDDLARDRFSILRFYERRVRRILPVLFGVLIVTTVAATALFLPEDFRNFGKSLLATALFGSNVQFWREADYFDAPALTKPLLHTWSLAVEEQFYILIPPALMLLSRWRSQWLVLGVLGVSVAASLAVSVWAVDHAPRAAFYLLPARAWELLIGSLLAYGAFPKIKHQAAVELLGAAGLLAILASAALYTEATPFPGLAALPPTVGALLVLYSGEGRATAVSRLLAVQPLRFVGLISYSLYMWHWPIIVLARYWNIRPITGLGAVGLVAASLFAAWLSWRYIERPFRAPQAARLPRPALFARVAVAMVAAVACGAAIDKLKGAPARMSPAALAILERKQYNDPLRSCHMAFAHHMKLPDLCIRGAPGVEPSFLMVGDSHAGALAHGVFEAARLESVSGYQLSDAGYRPIAPILKRGEQKKYAYMNRMLVGLLDGHPELKTVVVVVYWRQAMQDSYIAPGGAPASLAGAFKALMRRYPERQFVFVEPPPMSPLFGASSAARAAQYHRPFQPDIPRREFETMEAAYMPILQALDSEPNGSVIDTTSALCDHRTCHGRVAGELAYRDDNHLSDAAALKLTPMLRSAFRTPAESTQTAALDDGGGDAGNTSRPSTSSP
ncbi:acyltransferase family protein [Phenylobacterium sp.]|jgi:peptidoglycan/LPS O-acetylase OafA/YrhL|uniref:acyltransferase family protein n=1 Tax=Phenylobacterium sp. TaxID=1871053 RepID=UPI002F42E62C